MSLNATELRGAEYTTALDARRLSISFLGAGVVLSNMFMLATQYSYFPLPQALVTALSFPLLPFIVIWRRSAIGPWLGIAALTIGTLGTVFTAPDSDARISASTALFILAYCGVILLQGLWQWLWVGIIVVLWTIIVPVVALHFSMNGQTYNLRWGTLAQLIIAAGAAVFAWNREFVQVQARDELAVRVLRSRYEAFALLERLRVWRESLVRVHETVLNDIRSVIDAKQIDGVRLRLQLSATTAMTPPQRERHRLHELVAPLAVTQSPEQRLVIGSLPDIQLDEQRALALRSVLLEVSRNLFRHAGARTVRIEGVTNGDTLQLTVSSDAPGSPASSGPSGIGVGIVLTESLDELGASIDRSGNSARISVPLAASDRQPQPIVSLEAGRAVISAVGAGNAIGGSMFFFVLAYAYDWHGSAAAFCGLFTAALAVHTVWRRTQLSRRVLALAAIVATPTPILAAVELHTCARVELPLISVALTSLGFFAIVAWAPNGRWALVSLPFLGTLAYTTVQAMDACTARVAPPLVAAYAAPVLMGLVVVTSTISARSATRLEQLRLDEIRESAAADAAAAIGADLHNAVSTARGMLTDIANSGEITDVQRRKLRCIDSEIRATIQVDPQTSGAMALAARQAVKDAAANGVPTRVLVLRDSGDRRPLPEPVIDVLRRLLLAATDGSASLQILSDQREDLLSLSASDHAREAAGIPDGWTFAFESGEATVDGGFDNEPALMLIRRAVTSAPGSSVHPIPAH